VRTSAAPVFSPEPEPEPQPDAVSEISWDLSAPQVNLDPIPLAASDPIPVTRLDPIPLSRFEPQPEPVPVARFEPIPVSRPDVIPVARFEAPAAVAEFEPLSDGWVPDGLALAAAPLYDRPAGGINPARITAYQRMEAVARQAAGTGNYPGATDAVEQFLEAYPNDVEALEMLVRLGVDGGSDDASQSQLRLADACLVSGRTSSGRHVALDLLSRHPEDPAVDALVDRVYRAAGLPRHGAALEEAVFEAPSAVTFDDEGVELFDDDGLVTDEGRRRSPAASLAQADGDPLDDWLDASDEADARVAVVTASRLANAGNTAGAVAALEPLMRTPALRPIVGVQLAQLYRGEGDYGRALHCLEQAAEQPPIHADNAHALAYELALTLEAMGQRSEALGLYRELLREVGPAFRDVAARAEHLSAA
jgi:tetratricopeptide (TPR) repeat protein